MTVLRLASGPGSKARPSAGLWKLQQTQPWPEAILGTQITGRLYRPLRIGAPPNYQLCLHPLTPAAYPESGTLLAW